jgi:benzoyl-CoA 2,3-epoxidase subunit B
MIEQDVASDAVVEVSYDDLIPNNVDLANDRRLKKALESWHPGYIDWWKDAGPDGFHESEVYLRTAVGVDPKGWAVFDHVKMPDYRWGILLAPQVEGRTIPCGKHKGEPVWQEVPGEYRSLLRRLIVVQGDTEPASVEQQRYLGKTAPSLYDMRNLFQVNVEEGRHLWAMVYLLQKYFGSDGREEAEMLLQRRSGDEDKPRILFTYFTDRDGKMQLEALAQSGFDPLSRSCRFMLTEEAHHMFVGETGVGRVIEATCKAMNDAGITDPNDIEAVRKLGVIDLPTIQKKVNFHVSVTLDLFGAEISTNGAAAFEAGLKGRFQETRIDDDHQLHDDVYPVLKLVDGEFKDVEEPALNAINCRLRDDYYNDAQGGVGRWNKSIKKAGIDFELTLPHKAFNRKIGEFSGLSVTPAGEVLDESQWESRQDEFLASASDLVFISSLMKPVTEAGKYASWIAPPKMGINQMPGDYEYVKIHD